MPSMIYLWALLAVPCAALDEYTKYPTGDTFVRSCNENGIYALADREDVLQVRKHSSEPAPPTEARYDTGLCGVADMGDREAYLFFDLRDFSQDAVGSARLRMTPREYPPSTTVLVYVGCSTNRTVGMIDWTQQPRDRGVLACSWHSDASVLHDVSPRSCDVTAAVYDAAGADLCVNLVGVADESVRSVVSFHSSEVDDAARSVRTEADLHHGNSGGLMRGTVRGVEDTIAPNILINGTTCGTRFPDYLGKGCSASS